MENTQNTTTQDNNVVAINELSLIAEKSKLKNLRKRLLCQLAELGDAENVDIDAPTSTPIFETFIAT